MRESECVFVLVYALRCLCFVFAPTSAGQLVSSFVFPDSNNKLRDSNENEIDLGQWATETFGCETKGIEEALPKEFHSEGRRCRLSGAHLKEINTSSYLISSVLNGFTAFVASFESVDGVAKLLTRDFDGRGSSIFCHIQSGVRN